MASAPHPLQDTRLSLQKVSIASPATRVLGFAAAVAACCSALAVWASLRFFSHHSPEATAGLTRLVQAWVRWDSSWYADIARDGYWYAPGRQSPVAFFPGYPLAMRAFISLGVNRFTAGFLVSLLCGPLAAWLFTRWAMKLANPRTAFLGGLLLVVYPFALYLYGAVYSDALLLVLVTGAFLCLEQDSILGATVLGAAATLTRPVAPAVVLGLLVRQIERRREQGAPLRPIDFLPLLSIAGLAAYMAFLWNRFGDPLAFVHVQSAPGWDQTPGLQTWLKVTWFHILFPRVAPLVAVRLVGHALVALAALALAIPTRRYLGWGYAIYVAAAVGLPTLSSKDFMGLGRYVLAAFPVFLTLALLLKDKPRFAKVWIAASALLLAALTASFGAGGYVA
jgi:hypothetical protein